MSISRIRKILLLGWTKFQQIDRLVLVFLPPNTYDRFSVLWCFVHICFVQVTILNIVWSSGHADVPPWAHFSTDNCFVIQEGVITVEKRTPRGTSAHVGSATHCHLDKTNMDKTSQHRDSVLVCLVSIIMGPWLHHPLSISTPFSWARAPVRTYSWCV